MERIVGKLAMPCVARLLPCRAARGGSALLAALAALLLAGSAPAQAAAPVLQKVFVYAGKERIRLVVLFDKPLRQPVLRPQANGDAISFFLTGARGGRELRHFIVGQGGYKRVEAEEVQGGLRLTVRGEEAIAQLKNRLSVTAGGSAFTLTLPALFGARLSTRDSRRAGRETSLPIAVRPAAKRTEPLTPESILRQTLTSGAPKSAPSVPVAAARKKPAPAPRVRRELPAAFGPSVAEAAPVRKKPLTPADLGAGAPNLWGLMVQMVGALGGFLALILGGLAAFKKWGAKTAGRLGAGGKVVRTLHRVYLAPKQSIAIVEVAGEILVIGLSGQSISMLTKIENQAALAKLKSGGEASFVEQLTRLMSSKEKAAAPGSKEKPAAVVAALKAYGENAAAKGKGASSGPADAGNGATRPARMVVADSDENLPFGTLDREATAKAVARLRERLGRVSPQRLAAGVAS